VPEPPDQVQKRDHLSDGAAALRARDRSRDGSPSETRSRIVCSDRLHSFDPRPGLRHSNLGNFIERDGRKIFWMASMRSLGRLDEVGPSMEDVYAFGHRDVPSAMSNSDSNRGRLTTFSGWGTFKIASV
jgi:hypothetical protein